MKKFNLTILRNATVFGYSADRMRFDLVVNLMTASSFYEKKIYYNYMNFIKSNENKY